SQGAWIRNCLRSIAPRCRVCAACAAQHPRWTRGDQVTVTMNGLGAVLSGVCGDGQRWLPLSNVAAQDMVYVFPVRETSSGTLRTTLPTSAPDSVRACPPGPATTTLRVTWPKLSPGSADSDALTCTEVCDAGTVRVPCGVTVTPDIWT